MKSFTAQGGGRRDTAPEASDYVDCRVLAASTSEAHAVPPGAQFVNISATGDIWVKFATTNAAITIPGVDITDGTSPILNPGSRRIPAGAVYISIIAAAITAVTLEFYA